MENLLKCNRDFDVSSTVRYKKCCSVANDSITK